MNRRHKLTMTPRHVSPARFFLSLYDRTIAASDPQTEFSISDDNMPDLTTIEQELAALKEELEVAKVAKKVGEVCEELLEYSSQLDDPFDKVVDEPNQWHKNPGGGGCVIL